MRESITFFIVLIFTCNLLIAQPEDPDTSYTEREPTVLSSSDLNLPAPENVLVLYKIPTNQSDSVGLISEDVKDYYTAKYDIPTQNILGLTLPDEVTYDGHVVRLHRKAEVIKDTTSAYYDDPDTHAWEYYKEYVVAPIRSRLDSVVIGEDTLKYIIRYIVPCYGIPFKIQARQDWSGIGLNRQNVSLDGLLTILYYPDILDFFDTWRYDDDLENPYWQADTDYDFDMRFKSNFFANDEGVVLNYLVSRLDALDYATIEDMIDKSFSANYTGEATWILDGGNAGSSDITDAYNELNDLEFETEYDNSPTNWITTHANEVIGYVSAGTNAGMPSNYIQNNLDFDYANGSIFNTYESFNGESIRTLTRRAEQGLMTEFFLTEGNQGGGHTWEPYVGTVIDCEFWFPAYAMGYTFTDATYQGLPWLAYQNVIVGDPLSSIAWGKQTLINDTDISGLNLITGEIKIPSDYTLTIANSSELNFKHVGFITGAGTLDVGSNVTLNINNWGRGIFLDNSGNHPRILWGEYPESLEGGVQNYKIYSSLHDHGDPPGTFTLLATVDDDVYEYIDSSVYIGSGYNDKSYYLRAVYGKTIPQLTDPSNTLTVQLSPPQKSVFGNNNTNDVIYEYYLAQNYPNPFNPTTQIEYSIEKGGIVSLRIFDILGNEVAILVNEFKMAGHHSALFSGDKLPSGVYFYSLVSGLFSETKKLILLK